MDYICMPSFIRESSRMGVLEVEFVLRPKHFVSLMLKVYNCTSMRAMTHTCSGWM